MSLTTPNEPQDISSWDVWDTLVGRIENDRFSSFARLGHKIHHERAKIEFQSNGLFSSISPHMEQVLNDMTKDEKKHPLLTKTHNGSTLSWEEIEVQVEITYSFPIKKNILLVKPNDIIVIDSHWSMDNIKRLLQHHGIDCQSRKIYLCVGGKKDSTWDELNGQVISRHLGQEAYKYWQPKKDVKQNESNVIVKAIDIFVETTYSPQEKFWFTCQKQSLANICRIIRLNNPYLDKSFWYNLWNDYCEIVLPLIITLPSVIKTFITLSKTLTSVSIRMERLLPLYSHLKKHFPDIPLNQINVVSKITEIKQPTLIIDFADYEAYSTGITLDPHLVLFALNAQEYTKEKPYIFIANRYLFPLEDSSRKKHLESLFPSIVEKEKQEMIQQILNLVSKYSTQLEGVIGTKWDHSFDMFIDNFIIKT
jgi:hypothetical protein